MEKCLQCGHVWINRGQTKFCPSCNHEVKSIDGFKAYAPELANENDGFPPDAFEELVKYENTNFWFQSRNKLIIYFLKKYCTHMQNFLEIGCGTGFVSTDIRKEFPNIAITGSEIYTNGLKEALVRLNNSATLIQVDARHLPFTEEFDVIGAFDVIEHIEEDTKVLSEIYRALKPQGYTFIAVPQHRWMWSKTDDDACHVRRYAQNELQNKLKGAGFEIIRSTSFVSLLLPLMWLTRKGNSTESGLTIPTWQNTILSFVMHFELICIKFGFNLPLGGSRFVLARKS